MWRVRKLCLDLDNFKKDYYSEIGGIKADYKPDGVPMWKFVDYVLKMEEEAASKDKINVEKEILDWCSQEFFDDKAKGYWVSPGGVIVPAMDFIDLGVKGRKLVKGAFWKRWMYFFQFAYEEHSNVYSFIIGGGVAMIIGIASGIFQRIARIFF